ncbi:FadR/GntR family transcriptional regulator [Chitinophaga sp. 22321]|uniref:FadR family transcriptional regulator n=1 Tax=Chitinophaga hostae TaxID=2831022 RepID=A0ABS5IXQ6_9BACT|nr:GntR family transcriptional regulator [Chitinophaga hostae]MBS0027729.1 FadR family transcriptional regulator [Chitinophaga hostae]
MEIGNLHIDIEKVSHKTMADEVETKLLEYLKRKSFKPGDALPKEMELTAALGVSRNVLREALSRLRMLGLIETKKRRGMVLSSPDILGSMERVMDPLIIDDTTLQDIFELRLTLEMGLADILFLRKTKKDIEELEKIALQEKATRTKQNFRIKHEVDFHGKIYQMTGNRTLQRFQNMLLPIFGHLVNEEKVPIGGKVSHLDLVNLLKTGTREQFRQGMREHLEHHFQKLKK